MFKKEYDAKVIMMYNYEESNEAPSLKLIINNVEPDIRIHNDKKKGVQHLEKLVDVFIKGALNAK